MSAMALERTGDAMKRVPRLSSAVDEYFAAEIEQAKDAGALGFMARALVQATMPHKEVKDTRFVRRNGVFRLEMVALQSDVGLPYGTIPRLLMAWVSTEAVRKGSPVLTLGDSLSGFMAELGMVPTGGRWGTIARLRKQALRLFTAAVSCTFETQDSVLRARSARNLLIAEDYDEYWWKPRAADQRNLFAARVTLSDRFFREIVTSPVPVDLHALRALSKSPLAIDIYVWLTYRFSYLRRETTIPWDALKAQFGADYSRTRDFKLYFQTQLRNVMGVYPSAKASPTPAGLTLRPSPTHVLRQLPTV